MRKSKFVGIVALLSALCSSLSFGVTITFDDLDTSSGPVAISNQYQSVGAVFSSLILSTGIQSPAYVARDGWGGAGAVSLPNALVFGESVGFPAMATRMRFVDPASGAPGVTNFVSATVGDKSGETDVITLTAFALDGSVLGTSTFTSLFIGHFGTVQIAASGIHYVQFRDSLFSGGADADNITFNPIVTFQVPEPATAFLVLLGVLGFFSTTSRRN